MTQEQRQDIIVKLRLRSFEAQDFRDIHEQITTRTGDEGETQLVFGQRVAKSHPRIRLVGKLDLLSSFLNLAKIQAEEKSRHGLNRLQDQLVYVMGEVATHEDDAERYMEHYHSLAASDVDELEVATRALEASGAQFTGWIEKLEWGSALVETARSAAREAEAMAWELHNENLLRVELPRWLNRLSDYLWALAREK